MVASIHSFVFMPSNNLRERTAGYLNFSFAFVVLEDSFVTQVPPRILIVPVGTCEMYGHKVTHDRFTFPAPRGNCKNRRKLVLEFEGNCRFRCAHGDVQRQCYASGTCLPETQAF